MLREGEVDGSVDVPVFAGRESRASLHIVLFYVCPFVCIVEFATVSILNYIFGQKNTMRMHHLHRRSD